MKTKFLCKDDVYFVERTFDAPNPEKKRQMIETFFQRVIHEETFHFSRKTQFSTINRQISFFCGGNWAHNCFFSSQSTAKLTQILKKT